MKRAKALGRKTWNCGWQKRDRKRLNRAIETSFRQTEPRDVAEGLAEVEEDQEAAFRDVDHLTRQQILEELDFYDELAQGGALPASFELREEWLEEALQIAI